MDILQIFLVISLVLLTTLIIFLGVQLYHVLQEVRATLQSLQKTLDNAAEISDMVKNPVMGLTKINGWNSVLSGLREGIKLYKSFRHRDEQ
jgi:cell division protein FtsB